MFSGLKLLGFMDGFEDIGLDLVGLVFGLPALEDVADPALVPKALVVDFDLT